ncbi:hypothetical protein [Mucilaginibacter ginsenosidivorans]|uniref:Uncharacterized protein n=1 Tax=Mucilaginibacter ginsenosidivorans TaxID=398053 RepID=A0A5B8UW40_9SPHI|nr:hypothetical protein [Mucilaginibacter ginsenosidivorans]QEC63340.1 hypothetical protein FRZ54_12395 [Mucilaginibacter ginsenosidivorans]
MPILARIAYGPTTVTGTQVSGPVFIELRDAATGQLVNGNNVTVTYDMNINGTVTENSVTIAGQSQLIYYGILSDSDPFFFTKFQAGTVSAAPNPDPPVNRCDLVVDYISVDRPESAPGSLDAQITITATSSYLPIQYSNDAGTTWQLSPTFDGLTGGLHQFDIKDANTAGCMTTRSVTIPVLSNLLVSDPSVNLGNGNVSRWNAAFNPIVFTYQRKDFEVTSVSNDTLSGKALISLNAALSDPDTGYTVLPGDMVYVNAGNYKGIYEVNSITGNALLIETAFNGDATGFININRLRPYYKLITRITYQDPLSGQQKTITATNRPGNTGLVKADFSNFLQSLLRPKDDSDYTEVKHRDLNLSASYQIQYAESWDDGTTGGHTSDFISVSNPYYVVYAAKQLGQLNGGNLAAYVPFGTITEGLPLAKWITDFDEPAFSNGYPFDISFIYSEYLLGRDIYCEVVPLDINRDPLPGDSESNDLLNEDGSWLLNQDGSKFIISGQLQSDTILPAQLGLNRLLINSLFPAEAFYFTIVLKYNDEDDTSHAIMQTQTIRIDDAVDENSVYLRWIGLTGSWNYYRFVYNQEISLDVQNATIIKNYVYDWENQQGVEEVIAKSAGQKMKVIAEDLSINDIKGLQSIKYSPKVQMLVNKNPVKWQTIVINTATYSEYETLNGRAPFSITFNMPSINIQTQ